MSLDTVGQAMRMILDKFREEYGKNAKLEESEEITGVFNDGVVIISKDEGTLNVKVLAGEPYKFDFNLDLLEK